MNYQNQLILKIVRRYILKKYLVILIVSLLLTVSVAFNYSLSNKLNTSLLLSETLEVELQESDIDKNALEFEVSSLTEDMSRINEQLQSKTETLKLIDDKLETEGEILKGIDELITENNKLSKELDAVFLELNILEEENSKKIEGLILTEIQKEQWDRNLQDVLELLVDRILTLEEGISMLPTLSFERIMVKQEIDFLETVYLNIEKLGQDILDN